MPTKKIKISTINEMFDLGVQISKQLVTGDLIILTGDLGAGKTVLAKGIGSGLGHQTVSSPTFVISRIYKGKPNFIHIDAYRLLGLNLESFIDLDFATYLDTSIFVIEWGKDFINTLSEQYLELVIKPGESDDSRVVELSPIGNRWSNFQL